MFSQFFINRPRFALVISIVITLAGIIAIGALPIAQYPQIAPPQVQVSAVYPGASAEVVEATVAGIIEEQVNGVEGMSYMSSTSSSGSYTLNITFDLNADPDLAAVNVQNRVSLATSQLPSVVAAQGLTVRKQSTSMLQVYAIYSPEESYDQLFLSNYSTVNVLDSLSRVEGVGNASIFGAQDYGMRVWLDPNRMTDLNLTTSDISAAIQDQNVQAAAGQIGQAPTPELQQYQYTVSTQGRLEEPEEFGNIVLRSENNGSILRLSDVARVELGSKSYSAFSRFNGRPAVLFAVYQLPEANALDVASGVEAKMAELAKNFPADVEYKLAYDVTDFIRISLEELIITLLIALALVIAVVFIFLQDWRATLIPALAIPVSLVGTFAVFLATGFSINTITLFGLILAVGVVVDDAILVIENVQRHLEEGLKPKQASIVAMREVTGPVIASTLVLLAVFVPVAFTPGVAGKLYQQFALTIAISVGISSLVALTLSPALCATLLRANNGQQPVAPLRWFNTGFNKLTGGYTGAAGFLARHIVITLLALLVTAGAAAYLFQNTPSGFLPDEDQGVVFLNIQLPDGASLERTDKIMTDVDARVQAMDGVAEVISVRGFSLLAGSGSNVGLAIARLHPWDARTEPNLAAQQIARRMYGELGSIAGASVIAFTPPAIRGVGSSGGFEFTLKDQAGAGPEALAAAARGLIYAANQDPRLQRVYTTYSAGVPQLKLDVDRDQAQLLDVNISEIFTTLQANLGSLTVNDFNRNGRVYKVILQADNNFRDEPDDIGKLYVRSNSGKMVPLSAVSSVTPALGPETLKRYNQFLSASISGTPAAGVSSGEALLVMEELAAKHLPSGFTYEWTGASLQEKQSAGIAPILLLSLVFVFLFLVAQYESWAIPIAVLLIVPIAVAGALLGVLLTESSMDLYAQIGLIMLAGLSTKQAIVIVEFAKQRRDEHGDSIANAASTAARLRFRAVMMTALSFMLGILPLVIATGAGAGARQSLGMVVFAGMAAATVIGTLMVPGFYALVQTVREKAKRTAADDETSASNPNNKPLIQESHS